MKNLTFGYGVVIALLASMLGSIGYFAFTFLFSEDLSIRMLISGLAFVYILDLLRNSQERTGRITVLVVCFMLGIVLWFIYPPLFPFLVPHLLAIWLVRSLYCYASMLSALADLGLNALSIASAFWTLHHTGNLFLTCWCLFLVQALFVYIPTGTKRSNVDPSVLHDNEADFKRAYQTAEAAVRKLSIFN